MWRAIIFHGGRMDNANKIPACSNRRGRLPYQGIADYIVPNTLPKEKESAMKLVFVILALGIAFVVFVLPLIDAALGCVVCM
jgi:hypothetical protein